MQKTIIYITVNNINWVKGLEYFVDEWQLDYKVLHYKTIEDALQIPPISKNCIAVIIVDWELSADSLYMKEGIETLERSFPLIPVMALSSNEFHQYHPLSNYINKQTKDPEEIFIQS